MWNENCGLLPICRFTGPVLVCIIIIALVLVSCLGFNMLRLNFSLDPGLESETLVLEPSSLDLGLILNAFLD